MYVNKQVKTTYLFPVAESYWEKPQASGEKSVTIIHDITSHTEIITST